MKDLSQSDLVNAPTIIQYIWIASMNKYPIGSSTIIEAMEKYPEYFPDEIESQRKWALVPQETKDAYNKESWALFEQVLKDEPGYGKGLIHYITHVEDYEKVAEMREKKRPEYLRKMRLIHQKYLAKYEIEFDEKTV